MKVKIKYPKAKCAYCGKTYTKTHNRQTYCSDKCRDNARKEKRIKYNYKYYTKNKRKIHNTYLGTNSLAPSKNPDNDREAEIVQNEIRRIGLHIF